MDWVSDFYSVTGTWWAAHLAQVDEVDRSRAAFIDRIAPQSTEVLELGCGHGATAAAIADTGRRVLGIDLCDRVEHVQPRELDAGVRELRRADFYTVELHQRFDVVCYWDGFGVGDDDDQLRLLRRVVGWLEPGGVAIIEVFHPSGWAADDGLIEVKEPQPERGLPRRLGHRRSFDADTNTAHDTWWEVGGDDEFTQSLRCYRPTQTVDMATAAGLDVAAIADIGAVTGRSLETSIAEPAWSFVCVFIPPGSDPTDLNLRGS